jgi:hypothetical protein
VRPLMPPTPPALRIRTGQRPSKTRSAGSSSTCRQVFAPRCELFHLSVRTRRVHSGQDSSPQADSARSSVTSKQASPSSTGADPDSSGNPRALRPSVLRHRPKRRRERSSVRNRKRARSGDLYSRSMPFCRRRADSGPGYRSMLTCVQGLASAVDGDEQIAKATTCARKS